MVSPKLSANYGMRIISDLGMLDAARWNALADSDGASNPFVRHEFLHALQLTRCATASSGWDMQYLTLWEEVSNGTTLVGAVPLYLKAHSYGEYIFDWAWADAYRRNGVDYYPKWLCAIPFTPVPGPRLLARDPAIREQLAVTMIALAQQSELSSLHVLYPSRDEATLLASKGMLLRRSVQFHWFNRNYSTFDDYLAALTQPKRKKVRAERRKVAEAGVTFRRLNGHEASAEDWKFFNRCYAHTYAEHHSTPYLSLAFFLQIALTMPEQLLLTLAYRDSQPIAAALALFDNQRLYGRYWGALEYVPLLHFELSYYQLIEFAIERGLQVFEGGAQGEHKLARGFEPVNTHSAHWLAHPGFAAAIERFVDREADGLEDYVGELEEHSALKRLEL